ncbi:MAG: hypothetical protein K2N78_07530 [Oscillospiraceae bacterium]|nr:hypothetical protein [Oscillospiraceae bacterium]
MNVFAKRNIIIPGPNGEKFRLNKDQGAALPAWAEKSAYLKALEKDGKVILSDSGRKRPKKPAEPPAEPPADPPQDPNSAGDPDAKPGGDQEEDS